MDLKLFANYFQKQPIFGELMPNKFLLGNPNWSRRQLLKFGLAGVGITAGAALGLQALKQRSSSLVRVPPLPADDRDNSESSTNPMTIVRDFDYGTVKRDEQGRTIREFRIVAGNSTLHLNSAVTFNTWNFNNRVPGPTLRAREGDRIRVVFLNQGGHSHSMHFHGIHPANEDGIRPVRHGSATIYEFDAKPYGVQLYHCHMGPVTRHIGKGLYGMFIIDPPQARPPADEMVLVMGGFDVNEDQRNEFYAFNGQPDYYHMHPIPIYQNQLIRLYVLNMIELDPAVTFHIHANFFRVYPTGMTLTPSHQTDVITMGTAERHILEFAYPYTGKYMFHPHQDAIAEAGCMGLFDVIAPT
jgi:FtsP/CotA-like multicopper oxidase with cupredoxin domain